MEFKRQTVKKETNQKLTLDCRNKLAVAREEAVGGRVKQVKQILELSDKGIKQDQNGVWG